MRITENRSRQIIRSVIKESFEETGWGGEDGNRVSVGEVLDYFEEKNIKPIDMNIEEVFYKLSNGEETLRVITSEDRVNAANLDYPIKVIKRNGEIEYALDGNHRLQKAKNAGKKTIKAFVLDLDDELTPDIYKNLF